MYVRPASLLTAVLLALPLLAVTGPAHAAASCFGRRATIVGTSGNDSLFGTARRDVIVGKGGRDRIVGKGGNDLICGGGLHDVVRGGDGNDKIAGQDGPDTLFGGPGNDLLVLGKGFFQEANGEAGDDTIRGLPLGRGGFDFTSYRSATQSVQVDLAAGTATGEGTDRLFNIDAVGGSRFDDTLVGNAGSNFLEGLGGNDNINGAGNPGDLDSPSTIESLRFDFMTGDAGDDTLTGGDGLNVAGYDTAENGIEVDLQTGEATGQGNDTLERINAIVGTQFADTLSGNNQANGFEGAGGNDVIDGRGGEDVAIFVDADEAVADLDAGTASPTYSGFGEREPETGSVTLAAMEHIWGSEGPDTLAGDEQDNRIYGLGSGDDLSGAAGLDLLIGGEGRNDSATGGADRDICDAEEETDCEEDPASRENTRSMISFRRFVT